MSTPVTTAETERAPAAMSGRPWRGRLSRYTVGSVICFGVAEIAFFVLFGTGALGARGASVSASVIGVIPGYFLNRQWTWGRRGRSDFVREVLPYWATALLSAIAAAAATGAANHAVLGDPRAERTVINGAAYMVTYGVIFVAKFVLFERLFAPRGGPWEVSGEGAGPGSAIRDASSRR